MFIYLVMLDDETATLTIMGIFESETAANRFAKIADSDTAGMVYVDRRYLELSMDSKPMHCSRELGEGPCEVCDSKEPAVDYDDCDGCGRKNAVNWRTAGDGNRHGSYFCDCGCRTIVVKKGA